MQQTKVSYENRTSFVSVAIIDSSNKLLQAEKKKHGIADEMKSAIKTRLVLCLEVSKTIKSNQEVLL